MVVTLLPVEALLQKKAIGKVAAGKVVEGTNVSWAIVLTLARGCLHPSIVRKVRFPFSACSRIF